MNPGEVTGILIRRIIMQILIRCIDYHLDLFLEGDLPIEGCRSNVKCSDTMARKDNAPEPNICTEKGSFKKQREIP